jgi:hypothetical protein
MRDQKRWRRRSSEMTDKSVVRQRREMPRCTARIGFCGDAKPYNAIPDRLRNAALP